MEREKVVEGTMKWLEDVGEKAREEARALLQYVVTVEGLVGVREGLYQVLGLARDTWNKVAKDTLGKEICLWDTLYRQLLTDRVVEIVRQRVKEVVGNTKVEVQRLCDNWEPLQGEVFLWSEATSDLGNVWGKRKTEKGGLGMKCWGWNSCIQELCGGWMLD